MDAKQVIKVMCRVAVVLHRFRKVRYRPFDALKALSLLASCKAEGPCEPLANAGMQQREVSPATE
ncbi:hypothetical protein [Endozoicomonas atrinae]|uniref:hypothetical protein n=1 Tax=Endozoicomonas atrinae TaxID=1333660 RepID=UPI00082701AF|nr:hypothetical protein [Endozoicomonas atrinae]